MSLRARSLLIIGLTLATFACSYDKEVGAQTTRRVLDGTPCPDDETVEDEEGANSADLERTERMARGQICYYRVEDVAGRESCGGTSEATLDGLRTLDRSAGADLSPTAPAW